MTHFNSLQKFFELEGIDSIVVATPERTRLIQNPFSSWTLHSHYVANLEPNKKLIHEISLTDLQQWMSGQSDFYTWHNKLVIAYPIKAIDGKVHAYYLAFIEKENIQIVPTITRLITEHQHIGVAQYVTLGLLILVLIMTLLRRQKMFYKSVLDSESEIVIVSDGKNIKETNARFFDYLPEFNSLKGFKARYDCICDLFIAEKGFLQKKMGSQNWLEYLLGQEGQQSKVKIPCFGDQKENRIFHIKANRVTKSSHLSVVVLTDITENEVLNEKLLHLSMIDDLTNIANRRAFNKDLNAKIALAERHEIQLNLIIFDIDNFKQINDQFGHDRGDRVLETLTDRVKHSLRESDSFYRIGGEEFAVILLSQSLAEAQQTAEKVRSVIAADSFDEVGKVTVSLGVAEYQFGSHMKELFKQADTALYEAKEAGKNCAVVFNLDEISTRFDK